MKDFLLIQLILSVSNNCYLQLILISQNDSAITLTHLFAIGIGSSILKININIDFFQF